MDAGIEEIRNSIERRHSKDKKKERNMSMPPLKKISKVPSMPSLTPSKPKNTVETGRDVFDRLTSVDAYCKRSKSEM